VNNLLCKNREFEEEMRDDCLNTGNFSYSAAVHIVNVACQGYSNAAGMLGSVEMYVADPTVVPWTTLATTLPTQRFPAYASPSL
jgi:hypothetical protein